MTEEKRKLAKKTGEASFEETSCIESLVRQMGRNAVMCSTGAIALFIVTSLLIGGGFFSEMLRSNSLIAAAFLLGMVTVLVGVLYSFLDAKRGYEISRFDVRVDE